ncbi:MAG: outer membrane beta-barrel domain-containing protein [Bdellovibrionaceae bacterium]|nr:outer membrane beta-barrel domain-containing protein [Pseudobdellovibrionaceae bacterium]
MLFNVMLFFLITFSSLEVSATELFEVPEEELTKEVVLPRFDRLEMVRRPKVTFKNRFEIGVFGGAVFTEPIFNPYRYGLEGGYHFTENHSVSLSIAQWMSGLNNQYASSIEAQGGQGGDRYDLTRAPSPRMSYWLFYNLKAYYGKISLSKKDVLNMSLYTQLGVGATSFEHKTYPGVAIGIGQRFYFSPSAAIKLEARLQYQGSVNPFIGNQKLKKNQPKPSYSEFSDHQRFGTIIELGFVWLL